MAFISRVACLRSAPRLLGLPRLGLLSRHRLCSSEGESTLHKLGLSGLHDAELRKVFDKLCPTDAPGIAPASLAKTLSKAYGFDSSEGVTGFSSEFAPGSSASPTSAMFELTMLYTCRRIDKNKDGVISWEEFRSAVRSVEADVLETTFFSPEALQILGISSFDEASLRGAFAAADLDRSGSLDAAEIRELFVSSNPGLAVKGSKEFDQMVERVLKRLDKDGDEIISWEEFKSAFVLYQASQGWVNMLGAIAGWRTNF